MIRKIKIKRLAAISSIWIVLAFVLEVGHLESCMRGAGLFVFDLRWVKIDTIYQIWREYYLFRVLLLVVNSLIFGFCGYVFILVFKVIWNQFMILWRKIW